MRNPTKAPTKLVVKLGGALLDDARALSATIAAVSSLHHRKPGSVIIAHGGGSTVDRHLARLGMKSEKRDGIRITPPDQMAEISAVLNGQVNATLVAQLLAQGCSAVGLSLADGFTTTASVATHYPFDPGCVGEITNGNARLLDTLLGAGFLPVLSSVAVDGDGHLLNVNADDAAAALAKLVRATGLVFLTDVPGVRDGSGAVIEELNRASAEQLILDGTIRAGMIPKVRSAIAAAEATGISVIIASWNEPNLLDRIASGERVGSTILPPCCEERVTLSTP